MHACIDIVRYQTLDLDLFIRYLTHTKKSEIGHAKISNKALQRIDKFI